MNYDFSCKNFKEFCKTNNLTQSEGKNIVLERIGFLLDELEKLEGEICYE